MTLTQFFAFVLLPGIIAGLGYALMRRHERSLHDVGSASKAQGKTPIL